MDKLELIIESLYELLNEAKETNNSRSIENELESMIDELENLNNVIKLLMN